MSDDMDSSNNRPNVPDYERYDFDDMMEQVDLICDHVNHLYKHTNMTATECHELLTKMLVDVGMEPDCITLWQTLLNFKYQEELWDDLTPEQQAQEEHVPKGKARKEIGKAITKTTKTEKGKTTSTKKMTVTKKTTASKIKSKTTKSANK